MKRRNVTNGNIYTNYTGKCEARKRVRKPCEINSFNFSNNYYYYKQNKNAESMLLIITIFISFYTYECVYNLKFYENFVKTSHC